ncbi:MAG: hypothetical protein ACSHW0_10600 [Thalassotalea sp.]
MKDFLKKGIESARTVVEKTTSEFESGYSTIKEIVNGLPIFVSVEKSGKDSEVQFDEKHYFVIPYHLSDYGFALHTMRCLPDSIPDINNLPKRRVFHFPNEHSETMLKKYMVESAHELIKHKSESNTNSLESLANDIDALDSKLTYGMLVVGGLAAIANPVIGATIAAKAFMPSISGLINKYGIRASGEKLKEYKLDKSLKESEAYIDKEFKGANTLQVINPTLQELELLLRTDESQHDPLIDPDLSAGSIPELDGERWREFTDIAICQVYQDVYNNSKLHKKANLGPEDLRWLKIKYTVNKT